MFYPLFVAELIEGDGVEEDCEYSHLTACLARKDFI